MTTRIFFDNQTVYNFELIDIDKYVYGIISSDCRFFTFILPYYGPSPANPNPQRPFRLVAKNDKSIYITFYISFNGQILNYIISDAAKALDVNCLITTSMNIGYPYSQPLNNTVTNLGNNKSVTPVPIVFPAPTYNTFILYAGPLVLNNTIDSNLNTLPPCITSDMTYY